MIGTTRQVAVWAYDRPAGLRRGFDGLAALVSEAFRRDPLSGDFFLFVSRDRRRAKVLLWDGTGLCLYAKRLEQGRFAAPWASSGGVAKLTMSELALFLEGSDLVGRLPLSPPAFDLARGGQIAKGASS